MKRNRAGPATPPSPRPAEARGDRLLAARYAAALREHLIYVVVVVLLAVVAATTYVALADERFEATSEVSVPPEGLLHVVVPGESMQRQGDFDAAVRLAESSRVMSRASQRLGVAVPTLRNSIRIEYEEPRRVVSVTGLGGSPATAAAVANAYADALVTVWSSTFREQLRTAIEETSRRARTPADRESAAVKALERRLVEYRALAAQPPASPEVVTAAIPPMSSVWPRSVATVVIAAIGGLLLACVVSLALELASPILVRPDDVEEHGGSPLLGVLSMPTRAEARKLLRPSEPDSPELREKARTLSTMVSELLPRETPPKTLLVLGVGGGHGAAAVAAGVAGCFARQGAAVALADFDLERGALAKLVDGAAGAAPSVGRILMAAEPRALLDAIPPIPGSRLRILAARDDRHLAGVVDPKRVSALVRELERRVHALVMSGPAPSAAASETAVLLRSADAVLVVVALGHAKRDQIESLRQVLLGSGNARVGYVALERPRRLAGFPAFGAVVRRLRVSLGLAPASLTPRRESSPSQQAGP